MHALVAVTLAVLAACGAAAAPPKAPPAASSAPASAACDVAGRWELTVKASGCPVSRSVVLVDGTAPPTKPAHGEPFMEWTMTAARSSGGTCEIDLRGSAGRLFTVVARGERTGDALSASGRAAAGKTAYSCGGDVKVTGARR